MKDPKKHINLSNLHVHATTESSSQMVSRDICTQAQSSSISSLQNYCMDANEDHQCDDEANLSYREEGDYNEVGNALFRSEDNENSNDKDIQDNDEVLEFDYNHFDEYIDASSEKIGSDTETG